MVSPIFWNLYPNRFNVAQKFSQCSVINIQADLMSFRTNSGQGQNTHNFLFFLTLRGALIGQGAQIENPKTQQRQRRNERIELQPFSLLQGKWI